MDQGNANLTAILIRDNLGDNVPVMEATLEECIRITFLIPPVVLSDGRRLRITNASGEIQGIIPPMDFTVTDGDRIVQARFHPVQARWEILDGEAVRS